MLGALGALGLGSTAAAGLCEFGQHASPPGIGGGDSEPDDFYSYNYGCDSDALSK